MAGRIPRLSTRFSKTIAELGIHVRTRRHRALFAAIGALASAKALPGPGDFETDFTPGRAWVRRVPAVNLWLLFRFDQDHVFVMTVRDHPPTPVD